MKKSFSVKKVFQYFDKTISKLDISKFELGFTWTKEVKCNWIDAGTFDSLLLAANTVLNHRIRTK